MSITSKTTLVPTTGGTAPPSTTFNGEGNNNGLPNLLDYTVAESRIEKLVELSTTNEVNADTRRELRYVEVDVEVERTNGRLEPDSIYTPVRLANTNIEREQSKYVAYIKQPQRAAFFYCETNPSVSTELLALDFTKRFRYEGWDQPFYENIDRFQTHGWSVMEVQYDITKPGRFYNDAVSFEDFLMPDDTRDLQTCEMVGRIFHKTKTQLLSMVETHDFNLEQVNKICEDDGGDVSMGLEKTLYRLQKIFFRVQGMVFVGWSCHGKCSDWVRVPKQFHNGVIGTDGTLVFETNYPFVLFRYKISENPKVTDLKGRIFFDEYQQEAVTSLQSNLCTGYRRASAPYFSRDSDTPGTGQPNVTLKPGAFIDAKVKVFQLQYPDSSMVAAIQALITQNSESAGNISYAVNNRVDSRKTATEVQSAQAENNLLATTQTSLFSGSMTILLAMNWRIFSSQVVAGLIKPVVSPEYYKLQYILTPAGDIEVVARQEKLANMKQSWPVVQQSPIANEFLKRMLSLMFPEDAPVYNAMIADDQTKVQLIVELWHLVSALAIDPATGQLEHVVAPYEQQLVMMGEKVKQLTGTDSPFESLNKQQQPSQQNNNNENVNVTNDQTQPQ